MKKLLLLTVTLLLAAITCAACAQNPAAPEISTSSAPETSLELTEIAPAESLPETSEASAPEHLVVADAAMYRGLVYSVEETEDGKIITLQEAAGTDFGADVLKFRITADTKLSFEEPIAAGDTFYYEVYYGVAPGQTLDAESVQDAIAMNRYFDVAAVNFNGTLKEILPSDKAGEGQLVMEALQDLQEVVFNYSAEVQFYLDFAALKPGDKLNIFHKGIYTMSIPPQGIPLEVRYYAEPKAA